MAEAPAGAARRERLARAAFLNRLLAAYACSVSDWQGSAYVLSSRTGKTEIVNDLGEIWQKVEAMTGVRPDPLTLRFTDAGVAYASADHG
ncbi:hypothetical protein [Bordetella genomosp. 9]|nr:hypothetical protein [Bordetella genomosp. 9]